MSTTAIRHPVCSFPEHSLLQRCSPVKSAPLREKSVAGGLPRVCDAWSPACWWACGALSVYLCLPPPRTLTTPHHSPRTSRLVSNRQPEEKTLVPHAPATFQSALIDAFGPSNLRQNRERKTQTAKVKRV